MVGRLRVLVTGSRGRLGGELMRLLADHYEIVGVDHSDLDITDAARVRDCLLMIRPSVVLHTAAATRVDACEQDSVLAFAVNADGTRHVAAACSEIGARLVYYSTDYVFDGRTEKPYTERDLPNPISVYGRSKLAGEQLALKLCPGAIILRIAWLYGLSGNNFVKTMIHLGRNQIAASRQGHRVDPLQVVSDQTGNPTWTEEIVRQTMEIIERDIAGICHAVAHGGATWFEWAAAIYSSLDMEVELQPCSAARYWQVAKRPLHSVLVNSRLADAGADVMRPWQLALSDFLGRYRKELLA